MEQFYKSLHHVNFHEINTFLWRNCIQSFCFYTFIYLITEYIFNATLTIFEEDGNSIFCWAIAYDENVSGPRKWVCWQCGRRYANTYTLSRHVKIECGKSKNCHCSYCPAKFYYKQDMKRHCRQIHKVEWCKSWGLLSRLLRRYWSLWVYVENDNNFEIFWGDHVQTVWVNGFNTKNISQKQLSWSKSRMT